MPSQADLFGRGFLQSTADPHGTILSTWFWPSRDAPVDMVALLASQAGGAVMSMEDPEYPGHSMTADSIKASAEALWAESLLVDGVSGSFKLRDAKARYAFLATRPVGAALLIAKVPLGPSDSLDPSSMTWSPPVLLTLGVPSVTPQGRGLPPTVFPAAESREPPSSLLPSEEFFPMAFSAQADLRKEPAVVTATAYLRDVLLTFDGLRVADSVAVPASAVADEATLQQETFTAHLASAWAPLSELMQRAGGSLGVLTPPGGAVDPDAFCCILPRVLFLPEGFNLPVGQVWSPSIGLDGFLASLDNMSDSAVPTNGAWSSLYLQEWFNAVDTNPDEFAIQLLPRDVLAPHLVTGDADAKEPVHPDLYALDSRIRYRLHRDRIIANASPSLRSKFKAYETRAFDGTFQPDKHLGGCPLELAHDLWFLQPPTIRRWSTHEPFRLASFLDKDSAPAFLKEFLVVPVRVNGPAAKIPLETREEAEAAMLEDDEILSLDSLQCSRMESFQQSSKDGRRSKRSPRKSSDRPTIVTVVSNLSKTSDSPDPKRQRQGQGPRSAGKERRVSPRHHNFNWIETPAPPDSGLNKTVFPR